MSCGKRGLQDCVLCICARYEWSDIPENGKSLQQEDVALLDAPGRNMLINFAAGQEVNGDIHVLQGELFLSSL